MSSQNQLCITGCSQCGFVHFISETENTCPNCQDNALYEAAQYWITTAPEDHQQDQIQDQDQDHQQEEELPQTEEELEDIFGNYLEREDLPKACQMRIAEQALAEEYRKCIVCDDLYQDYGNSNTCTDCRIKYNIPFPSLPIYMRYMTTIQKIEFLQTKVAETNTDEQQRQLYQEEINRLQEEVGFKCSGIRRLRDEFEATLLNEEDEEAPHSSRRRRQNEEDDDASTAMSTSTSSSDTDSDSDDDDDSLEEGEIREPKKDLSIPLVKPLFAIPCGMDITDCPICMEKLEMVNITITTCGHTFHSSCIFTAIEKSENCPMCRNQLVEYPQALDEEMSFVDEEEEDSDEYENAEEQDQDQQDTEDEPKANLEQMTAKLVGMGYTIEDLVKCLSLQMVREVVSSTSEARYTDEFIDKLEEDFEGIITGEIPLSQRDNRSYAKVAATNVTEQEEQVPTSAVVELAVPVQNK